MKFLFSLLLWALGAHSWARPIILINHLPGQRPIVEKILQKKLGLPPELITYQVRQDCPPEGPQYKFHFCLFSEGQVVVRKSDPQWYRRSLKIFAETPGPGDE